MGIEVVERAVDKTELFISDEVFLTGTAAKITPIKNIESTQLNSNMPLMLKLRERLLSITNGIDDKFSNWVTRVELTN